VDGVAIVFSNRERLDTATIVLKKRSRPNRRPYENDCFEAEV